MKLFLLGSLLPLLSLAAPTPPTVTFAFVDEQRGPQANKPLKADGTSYAVATTWAGTVLQDNLGRIRATAAQINGINPWAPHVVCTVTLSGSTIATLTQDQTYRKLSSNGALIDITNAVVKCTT